MYIKTIIRNHNRQVYSHKCDDLKGKFFIAHKLSQPTQKVKDNMNIPFAMKELESVGKTRQQSKIKK